MAAGWIKLHRRLLSWEWFKTPHMVHLFMYLVLKANHEDGSWQGKAVKRGQLITGLHTLNKETGLSIQTIRTCLERLKKTTEINTQSTSKYTLITICKYEDYNTDQQTKGSKLTSGQQSPNKPLTTNNNTNTINSISKEEKEEKNAYSFDDFWAAYGKPKDRAKCELKWAKLSNAEIEFIKGAVGAYVVSTPEKQFRKNPLTWINGKCWNDEIILPAGVSIPPPPAPNAGTVKLKAVEMIRDMVVYDNGTSILINSEDERMYKAGLVDLTHFDVLN